VQLSNTSTAGRGSTTTCRANGAVQEGTEARETTGLATANEVHPRTMSRALRRLRELGYITYRRGYGYFVSHTPPGCELRGFGASVLR
jgi:DNA-binding transcriptional regulator YhcF (GntR family)